MAEQNPSGDVQQYRSLPRDRVGIVQNIQDVSIVRGDQTLPIPATLRIPSRDAFLALHRSILRISSSVELSVSSKASSVETLNEPSAVARWSERFEEAFHSESSLATDVAKMPEEKEEENKENEKQKNSKPEKTLPNSKSNPRSNPCSPLVISPNCPSITSVSCASITSGSITGFEFPVMNNDRGTLDQSAVTNGDTTLSITVSNYTN